MTNVIEEQVAAIQAAVGDKRVLCGLSGGVDSAVAAALVQRAVGDHLTCVFVDHGLLRAGEAEQVERDFVAATGVDLKVVDARDRFLDALAGVTDPEEKRKIIGREFIRVFEAAAREVIEEAGSHGEAVDFLVQGTLYPDVVESGGGTGTANIKSHHNVGRPPGRPRSSRWSSPCARSSRTRCAASASSSGCPSRSCGASRSRARPRDPHRRRGHAASGSRCCGRPTPSPARSSPPPASTARSGSARWCSWPTSARSASRATAAPTATRSCCAPCPARTP